MSDRPAVGPTAVVQTCTAAVDVQATVPDVQRLEALRATLAAKLYAEMIEPGSLRAFRELLRSPDRRVRLQAWELALQHGWPVKEGEEERGPAQIVIVNHIPRPPKDVTVEVESSTTGST